MKEELHYLHIYRFQSKITKSTTVGIDHSTTIESQLNQKWAYPLHLGTLYDCSIARQTFKQIHKETKKPIDRINKQTDRKTDRHTDIQVEKHTDILIYN